LRRPLPCRDLHASDHDPGVEIAADELEHPPVADLPGHSGHEGVVLNSVEEPVQIDIDDPGPSRLDFPPRRLDGLVGTPSGPEAEASVREHWLEDGS